MASRTTILSGIPLIPGALFILMLVSYSTACPETCFCMDAFVTCSEFKTLNLSQIPDSTDTLVLSRGKMEEIPANFFAHITSVRFLEISSLSAKVVRSGAFAGLSYLDLFSITNTTFDVVEPEGFSDLIEVSKFHISDSNFGRIERHAFAKLSNVADFRIWSNTFDTISDEIFHKLSDISSLQIYQNNITSLGSKLFLDSSDIDEITIYKNEIRKVAEGCFRDISKIAKRVVFHANTFVCSCDEAWFLTDSFFVEHSGSNECLFPSQTNTGVSIFRIASITRKEFCPAETTVSTPRTTTVRRKTTGKSSGEGTVSTGTATKLPDDKSTTVSPRISSTLSASTTKVKSPQTSSSTQRQTTISTTLPSTSPSTSQSSTSYSSSESSSSFFKPIPEVPSGTGIDDQDDLITIASTPEQSRYTSTTQSSKTSNTKNPGHSGDLTREGLPVTDDEDSSDEDEVENPKLFSTSATRMASLEDHAFSAAGNVLFIMLSSFLCILLS